MSPRSEDSDLSNPGDRHQSGIRAPKWVLELRRRAKEHRLMGPVWTVGVLATGMTLVVAGLAMFVLPGPGFVVLILGLVVLASEFAWATRALEPVQRAAKRAQVAAMDPQRRRRNAILAGVVGVAVGVAITIYVQQNGLTLSPITTWVSNLFR